MNSRNQSTRTVRIVSTLLALVWLGAGLAAIVLALMNPSRWLLGVVGAAALCYGLLWMRVARLGRRLTLREALMPWRAGRQPNA
jgi:Flp pilus assembly protein TadB